METYTWSNRRTQAEQSGKVMGDANADYNTSLGGDHDGSDGCNVAWAKRAVMELVRSENHQRLGYRANP